MIWNSQKRAWSAIQHKFPSRSTSIKRFKPTHSDESPFPPYLFRLDLCSKNRDWRGAIGILKEMEETKVNPDVHTYTSAIKVCFKSLQPGQVKKITRLMDENEVSFNSYTYSMLIRNFGKMGKFQDLMHFWSRYRQEETEPSLSVYNAFISALSHSSEKKHTRLAMDTFTQMKIQNIRPDMYTFNSLLVVCRRSQMTEEAREIMLDVVQSGQSPDAISFSTIISMFGDCREWDSVLEFWSQAQNLCLTDDKVLRSAMARACVNCEQWQLAIDVGEKVDNPNSVLETTLSSAREALGRS